MEQVAVRGGYKADSAGAAQRDADAGGGDAAAGGSGGGYPSRRQISHDIRHELATIILLATLLTDEPDAGPQSRHRARLILGEARWLEQLQRAYESADSEDASPVQVIEPVRVDDVGADVVEAIRSSTLAHVTLSTEEVYGWVNRLALWRALRNVLDNAVRAAGSGGAVGVRIFAEDGWVTIQIDDNGPGFGLGVSTGSALGLNIVQQFVSAAGGQLEITRGFLGGCCVRMQIPEASRSRVAAG